MAPVARHRKKFMVARLRFRRRASAPSASRNAVLKLTARRDPSNSIAVSTIWSSRPFPEIRLGNSMVRRCMSPRKYRPVSRL